MSRKEKNAYQRYEKKFLDTVSDNGADEFATVSFSVTADKSYQSSRDQFMKVSMDANMRISDCQKHIVISLYAEDSAAVQERINKLYVLREQVDKAIEAMHECREVMMEVEKQPNPKWDGKTIDNDDD